VSGQSFPTYLFNQVHAHGVPYYFPAAFVVKSTLGFMLLLVLACYAVLSGGFEGRRKLTFLILPPTLYLIIAMFTGLNIGARHILPMYPFLAVFIGGAVVALGCTRRVWMVAVSALLAWHVVSSMRCAPVYLAYSNDAWGGPSQTYRYLTDSNVDWGQQLMSVKAYVDGNGIKDCWFGYFVEPWIDYRAYGIPCKELPTADTIWGHAQVDTPPSISGVIFISASVLTGYEFGSVLESPYQPFMQARPVATIDHGVFVYSGKFDTSFASALGDTTRATALFDRKDFAGALAAAQHAVATDPDVLPAQSILGDTLAALHRDQESAAAYDKALAIAAHMEPDAKADRQRNLIIKKRALHL
jgi:hypothetical protein